MSRGWSCSPGDYGGDAAAAADDDHDHDVHDDIIHREPHGKCRDILKKVNGGLKHDGERNLVMIVIMIIIMIMIIMNDKIYLGSSQHRVSQVAL